MSGTPALDHSTARPLDRSPSRRVLLGVTGGIAAYKSLELVRLLRRAGYEVQVVMTDHARRLIGAETFASLSGRPVAHELFPKDRVRQEAKFRAQGRSAGRQSAVGSRHSPVAHVDLAAWADLVLVAPATANIIGKLASGIADDLLSTLLLAVPRVTRETGRVILAPAMNTNMWLHPSVAENIARLRALGYVIAEPDAGSLACGTSGPGRMQEPAALFDLCRAALAGRLPDLSGLRVLITAGRTEEPIDPVRVITNRSTGRLGLALCRLFALARARVKLIAGPLSVPLPSGVDATPVSTTEEMLDAVTREMPQTDVLVMCAAPADYRAAASLGKKTHSRALTLALERTPDILKAVSRLKHSSLVIGFSLDPSQTRAHRKLKEKKLDLVVANDFATPGSEMIRPALVWKQRESVTLPEMSKDDFGRRLVLEVAAMWKARSANGEVRTAKRRRRR